MKMVLWVLSLVLMFCACDINPNSNEIDRGRQEVLLKEAASKTGMPAIKNFREKKLLKLILEMRDQEGLVTYSYFWSEFKGKLVFFCDSIGYGIPYSTQYTNPLTYEHTSSDTVVLNQADPNGLFSPASADGTWVLCKDPGSSDVKPVYSEPKLIVSPFRLRNAIYDEDTQVEAVEKSKK